MSYSKKKKKIIIKTLVTLAIILGALFGASKIISTQANHKEPIIAKINGDTIYQSDISKKLNEIFETTNQNSPIPPIADIPKEVLNVIIKEIYIEKQLTKQAKHSGIQKDKDVAQKAEEAKNAVLLAAYLEDVIKKEVTNDAIHHKYLELNSDIAGKKEYAISHIVVEDEKKAQEVLEEIKQSDFAQMAKKYSIDFNSAAAGGDLGYVLEDNLVNEMGDIIRNLQINEISKPVKTEYGWHLIQVREVRDAKMPEFNEVKLQIEEQLKQDTLNQIKSKIIDKAQIEILVSVKEDDEKTAE